MVLPQVIGVEVDVIHVRELVAVGLRLVASATVAWQIASDIARRDEDRLASGLRAASYALEQPAMVAERRPVQRAQRHALAWARAVGVADVAHKGAEIALVADVEDDILVTMIEQEVDGVIRGAVHVLVSLEEAPRDVWVKELQKDDHAELVSLLNYGSHSEEGSGTERAVVRKGRGVTIVHGPTGLVVVARVVAAR